MEEQGALINILDHVDQMPNLQEWMEIYPDEARRALSHDGKMYVAPSEGIGETERRLWLYRKDIFDKHDLEVPDNWDELYTALKELKEIYPDSYPFGYRQGTDKNINLAVNFGTHHAYYYDFDEDEWRYGPIEDNYRELVEYLKKFYDEGLIPPDFLSIDTEGWQKLMTTEVSYVTQDYIGRIDTFNDQMRKENPDFSLINMPPPAGFPDGEQLDYSSHVWMRGFSISRDTEHLDDALRFLDWTYTEEGKDTLSWGIEGETYTIEDGEKAWIEDYDSPADSRSDTGLSLFSTYSWFDYDSHMVLFSDEVKKAYEEYPQYDAPVIPTPAFTKEEQEEIAIQGEAIEKHRDEEIAKFIIGKRDLSEWDDYVEETEKLDLQGMIDIYKDAYNRMIEVDLE